MASSAFFSVLGFVRRLLQSQAPPAAVGDAPDPGARLSYGSEGRSGRVHYQSRRADFTLYYEFGGGDCVATIDLPSLKDWPRHTGLPQDQRDGVIEWIGRQVVRDQTTGGKGRYEVEGNWLNIYSD
jgi:hypothetical protein